MPDTVRLAGTAWDEHAQISAALLGDASPAHVETDIRFHVANGQAEYRVVGWNHAAQAFECALVEGHVEEGA